MSDHRQMRKLTVKTGKKISAEAEATLQATFKFKNQLSEHIEVASTLRSEYDKLRLDSENLEADNARLATEPSASDTALQKELESSRKEALRLRDELEDEQKQSKEADRALADLQHQCDSSQIKGNSMASALEKEREQYQKLSEIDIRRVSDRENERYQVVFLDMNQSVDLIKESPLRWHIDGSAKPIQGDASNWLGFTRMSCEAREILKKRYA